MKLIKLFALTLCAASLLLAGCKTCCKDKAAAKASCGMQCCIDAKATCATCPKCSANK